MIIPMYNYQAKLFPFWMDINVRVANSKPTAGILKSIQAWF